MKILYDNQIFTLQNFGGISRYFYELMNHFYKNKEINFELALVHSDNHYLKDAKFYTNFEFLFKKYMPFKKKIKQLLQKLNESKASNALKKQNFDIFHPTYYGIEFLDYIGKKPFVLTVHDMIHELFPKDLSKDLDPKKKKKLIEKASKIIAVSKNTKKDIIKFYGIDENKIKVIYHGGSSIKRNKIKKYIELPKKYLLFVGHRWIYKNFTFFIDSVAPLMKEDGNLNIICAGSFTFDDKEKRLFTHFNITDRVVHYHIPSNDFLAYLYQNALVFVYPSLYEGFGLPILESFHCGCPAIVSNTSSLPEVAGHAAIYINPKDKKSIKNAVEKVIYNESLRQDLISRGYKQEKKFSWQKTAEQTKIIYESVL